MIKSIAMLTVVCFTGACPMSASARPHHRQHVASTRPNKVMAAPFALRIQPISYDVEDNRATRHREFNPGPIGAPDRIPLGAAEHFGRRGVASVGYQAGAGRSPVEAHELNAAFSSQAIGFGGAVGGDVSIHF